MKEIIGGKKYDTNTAELIAEWNNGYYRSNFKRCEESLYRTTKGAWFVAGEGGPMSKYARPVGDMTSGGGGLTPLTDDEAYEWLENKREMELIEEYFPERIEEA